MAAYWGIAAHSAYDMFSWYKYLNVIVSFFPPLGLLSGNFFLISPFPDHCLFDLFLCCYERDFMDSIHHDNQADVIEAFNSTSRYLDDLLNIGNPYFEGMINQFYPPELQLNNANTTYTEAPF